MDIGELLTRDAIAARVVASSKRQALAAAAELAARKLGLDAPVVLEALLEREAQGSTGVGQGVAVPHARVKGLKRMHGVFLKLETPIAFEAVDDRPVDLLFVLIAPKEAGVDHLRALARVSRKLRQAELREQLRQARTPDAIYALLVREAESNAA
jgi:PTS system nitrogen regulatory IIA component